VRRALLTLVALLGACEASGPAARTPERAPSTPSPRVAAAVDTAHDQAVGAPTTQPASAAAERRFGSAPTLPGDPIAVSALLAAPEPHLGKTVKCEGKVARVCQNAGCWLELQADSGEGLRVPMAGHSFFIPQDAVGRLAVVEGSLRRHELPARQREHYQGEGMQAVGPLSLEATSVVLR